MNSKSTTHIRATKSGKKVYQTPKLQPLGSVKKLTLKLGSNVDGMGGFM